MHMGLLSPRLCFGITRPFDYTSWSAIMNIIKLLYIKVVITKMVEQVM